MSSSRLFYVYCGDCPDEGGMLMRAEDCARAIEKAEERLRAGWDAARELTEAEAIEFKSSRVDALATALRDYEDLSLWGANDYGATYRADGAPHKDYRHAVLHLVKSVGRLAELPEEMDHEPVALAAQRAEAQKRLADLVIIAIRMAETCPAGGFDLGTAVEQRIREKFKRELGEGAPRG